MIATAKVRPKPRPRNFSRRYKRFISQISGSSLRRATHPAASPLHDANSNLPDGGAYSPGSPASSRSKLKTERLRSRLLQFPDQSSPNWVDQGSDSSANIKD